MRFWSFNSNFLIWCLYWHVCVDIDMMHWWSHCSWHCIFLFCPYTSHFQISIEIATLSLCAIEQLLIHGTPFIEVYWAYYGATIQIDLTIPSIYILRSLNVMMFITRLRVIAIGFYVDHKSMHSDYIYSDFWKEYMISLQVYII